MKIRVFILLVLAGATLGSVEKRITGLLARKCGDNEGLHHVILSDRANPPDRKSKVTNSNLAAHCGGSLIHERWVLTAKHCQEYENGDVIQDLVVTVGHHPNSNGKLRTITRRVLYQPDGHDIMLLELDKPAKGDTFTTVTLPGLGCNKPADGTVVKINSLMGAIRQRDGKKDPYASLKLNCGELDVAPCGHPPYGGETFCAFRKGIDANKGDSGSGLIVRGVLHGVLIAGLKKYNEGPIHFMDVCHYRQWIQTTAGI